MCAATMRTSGSRTPRRLGTSKTTATRSSSRSCHPLVAPAPSPAPLSESESEYSPDEDDDNEDKQEHGGDWGPLASVPRFSCTSSSCSSSYGDPLLAPPPPQPLRTPAESAHPTPALCSRWSSSTLSSLHSTHGRARASKTFSFGRYLPRARPTTKPKPKSSVARPVPRPMGSVTVLPPPPRRLRAPDYAESSRSSSGSVSAGWSYAAAIAQRSVASPPPSAAGHHSAQSSVSGHSAHGSLSMRVANPCVDLRGQGVLSSSHVPLSFIRWSSCFELPSLLIVLILTPSLYLSHALFAPPCIVSGSPTFILVVSRNMHTRHSL
ncbi:hypothetical protein B0H14DRAFT_689718 [Mycena olivaceomarginata]|nr:hypothetical protein B0H14DRAFT_689718 [Mycena olivaceomarginata]